MAPVNPGPIGLKSLAQSQQEIKNQTDQMVKQVAKLEERVTNLSKKLTENEQQINSILNS